jgi:hypothetical protein
MDEIYRERVDGIGWVAVIRFIDGRIGLRIRGEWVYEEAKKHRSRPFLKIISQKAP